MKKLLPLACLLIALAPVARAAAVQENWQEHCASCHGKDGKGATKAGRMARVKDLTDPAYQKTFADEKAATAISEGQKDEKGKEKMKPFSEKLTAEEIKALVAHVRALTK